MKKNASYETHRPPVHEEVQLQDKAKPTDVRFKLTDTISRSNDNKTNCSTLNKKETNLKPKCNALVAVISLLVIVMVATVALFAYALVSSNQGMDILMQEIQELKLQLNKTKEESEADFVKLKKEFTQLETEGLNTLSTAIDANMEQFTSLQSSVSSLNTANGATTTQLNSLESSVRFLNTATTNQLNSLQFSVSSLTTRVNSPVNLYQNCIQETRSCTSTSGSGYLKSCTTSSLTVNKLRYYTLSMACKYDPSSGSLPTTALCQSGSKVHCHCVTTSSISSSTGNYSLETFSAFTCRLVITRCLTSQNIVYL